MNQSIYITTSIPYVNSTPHLGFGLELVQADVLARYHRLLGWPTRFQTGTDENSLKNVLAARENGLPTQELVDRNAEAFRRFGQALSISADTFIRTTEPRHRQAVHAFWRQLAPGDVYQRTYNGLYCVGCEDFYLPKDLVAGRCPDHGTEPVPVQEHNYFFRLSAYQQQVEELLASGQLRVTPSKRLNEVLSFVRGGLQDFSISRPADRAAGWGIRVPGDPSQVIYVWIDALINYLSGQGYGTDDSWQSVWNTQTHKLHVVGKNVWKFHAVYWPALLLSAGLPLPNEILVHGFLTENGRKISKSLGNATDPFACVETFGADGVRYYLLAAVSPFDDGDFSATRLHDVYNAELANGLGNLVSRLTRLAEKVGNVICDAPTIPSAPPGYHEAMRRYELDKAIESLWAIVADLNRQIELARPWEAIKARQCDDVRPTIAAWLVTLHQIGYWLQPFLPTASERILQILSVRPIQSSAPLFPRVE